MGCHWLILRRSGNGDADKKDEGDYNVDNNDGNGINSSNSFTSNKGNFPLSNYFHLQFGFYSHVIVSVPLVSVYFACSLYLIVLSPLITLFIYRRSLFILLGKYDNNLKILFVYFFHQFTYWRMLMLLQCGYL